MINRKVFLSVFFFLIVLAFTKSICAMSNPNENPNKLAVLWTSGDPEVAHKVCFMYTHNAKIRGWFDEVVLIIWGPSAKLLSEDQSLQERILEMKADGIILEACIACADMYGVSDDLRKLGIDVKGMGVPLSDYLKENRKVITF